MLERIVQIVRALAQRFLERVHIHQRTETDGKNRGDARRKVGDDGLVTLQGTKLGRRNIGATLDDRERASNATDRQRSTEPCSRTS